MGNRGKGHYRRRNGPTNGASYRGSAPHALGQQESSKIKVTPNDQAQDGSWSVGSHQQPGQVDWDAPIPPRPEPWGPRSVKKTIPVYNIKQSTDRLIKTGLHPEALSGSLSEHFQWWLEMSKQMGEKVPPPECRVGPRGVRDHTITMATLVMNPQPAGVKRRKAALKPEHKDSDSATLSPSFFLRFPDVADTIAENVFASGLKAAQNLALSSRGMWAAVALKARVWNFAASEFEKAGIENELSHKTSSIFLAVNPEYRVGDVLYARDHDPLGRSPVNPLKMWWKKLVRDEMNTFEDIFLAHEALKNADFEKIAKYQDQLGPATMEVLYHYDMENEDSFWQQRQLVDGHDLERLQITHEFFGRRMINMIVQIKQAGHAYKVMHFENIPYLDRRMLAIILRSCPNVKMIGVYNCPLINFGDIICILDLIYEVNQERRKLGQPLVEGFDFFPFFEKGNPYTPSPSGTFGLTWRPVPREEVQRGFYGIILKAFLKAEAMNLQLLFDKDNALRDFLLRVPNVPYGVPLFLDALYRLLDISRRGDQGHETVKERKKATWDLRKPVRLGLRDKWHLESPKDFDLGVERRQFCISCGYEMLDEFFQRQTRSLPSNYRMCAACSLQEELNNEMAHQMKEQRECLDHLFPGYDKNVFNKEAPISTCFHSVMNLKSVEAEAYDPTAGLYARHDGQGLAHNGQPIPFARWDKATGDSLQGLPTLQELTNGNIDKRWDKMVKQCQVADGFRCAGSLLYGQFKERGLRGIVDKEVKDVVNRLLPTGKPSNLEEQQCFLTGIDYYGVSVKPCHDYTTALQLFLELMDRGDLPGGPIENFVDQEAVATFRAEQERAFW